MDKKGNVTEELQELMDTYSFSVDTLSEYLELPAEKVEVLSHGDISCLPEDDVYRLQLFNRISSLYSCAAENKDSILCGFLKVLISRHRLSKETIARISGAEVKDIDRMLSSPPKAVSDEIKYRVAVTAMSLRFYLKECEPEWC